jgi:hypothetical protein
MNRIGDDCGLVIAQNLDGEDRAAVHCSNRCDPPFGLDQAVVAPGSVRP